MQLKDRNRHRQEETKCDMCGAENEDLRHFLLWCPAYVEERKWCVRLQQPYVEEEDGTIGSFYLKMTTTKKQKQQYISFGKLEKEK